MRYIELGSTGLRVSRVCFGTWSFGGDWGPADLDAAKGALRRALDLGINFVDTAQAYGFGISESAIAEALGHHRPDVVIATKGGLRPEGNVHVRDARRDWLRRGLEDSLKALRTDYVDVYLLHWPDPAVPMGDVAQTLDSFVREGKARFVGVSNFTAAQVAELEKSRKVDVSEPPFHLFRRDAEGELFPYCLQAGIGTMVYGTLSHGLLTGKTGERSEFNSRDWRSKSGIFHGNAYATNSAIVEQLRSFAYARGISLAQLAIGWVLAKPAVHSAIVGARAPHQVDEIAAGADVVLTSADMAEIESLTSGYVSVGGAGPEGVW